MMKNQSGMTLMQVIVGMSISMITLLSIGGLMSKSVVVAKEVDIQMTIDTLHANTLHRVGKFDFLKTHFQLSDSGTANLTLCLRGEGTSCSAFQKPLQTLSDAGGTLNGFYSITKGKCAGAGSDCIIEQKTDYQWTCARDNECESLKINVTTKYTGTSTRRVFRTRSNDIVILGRGLVSRADISFACTSAQILKGVNHKSLKAICSTITGATETDDGIPAKSVGLTTVNEISNFPGGKTCVSGFTRMALFSKFSDCGSSAESASTTPTTTTTTTTVTTTTTTVPANNKKALIPKSGQHCDIGGKWGWQWNAPENCHHGSAAVPNFIVPCPDGSVSFGQGCYVANNSTLGHQLCPGADQDDECCFYPCQENAVEPPTTCKTVPMDYCTGQLMYECDFLDTHWYRWKGGPPPGATVDLIPACKISQYGVVCEPWEQLMGYCKPAPPTYLCHDIHGKSWETDAPPTGFHLYPSAQCNF